MNGLLPQGDYDRLVAKFNEFNAELRTVCEAHGVADPNKKFSKIVKSVSGRQAEEEIFAANEEEEEDREGKLPQELFESLVTDYEDILDKYDRQEYTDVKFSVPSVLNFTMSIDSENEGELYIEESEVEDDSDETSFDETGLDECLARCPEAKLLAEQYKVAIAEFYEKVKQACELHHADYDDKLYKIQQRAADNR